MSEKTYYIYRIPDSGESNIYINFERSESEIKWLKLIRQIGLGGLGEEVIKRLEGSENDSD